MANNTTEATREVRATAKYVRVTPRKARAVIDLIRGKSVAAAFDILHFCDRAVAVDIEKVLRSAVANAENNNGMRARAKGSASRILKRTSHITVVVAPGKEA